MKSNLGSPAAAAFLRRPDCPRKRNAGLDRCSDPHRDIDFPRRLCHPASGDGTDEQHREAEEPPVADRVPQLEQVRVGAEVIDRGGDDDGRHLWELHVSGQADLARGLETEERDGDLVDPVDVVADVFQPTFDHFRLDEDGTEKDDARLDEERDDQRCSLGSVEATVEACEAKSPGAEADERSERLGPAVGSRGGVVVGRTKTEKHGVPSLHRDEGPVGAEDGAVQESRCEPTEQQDMIGIMIVDGGLKVLSPASSRLGFGVGGRGAALFQVS